MQRSWTIPARNRSAFVVKTFMDEYAKRFNTGKCRRHSKAYQSKLGHFQYLKQRKYSKDKWDRLTDEQKMIAKQEMKQARDQMMGLECGDPMDESYRRVVYVRYADDFLIGVIGPKQDAETIKQDVGVFLKNTLHLDLSAEKTLITHSKDKAHFLGYDIFSCKTETPKKDARGFTRRSKSGRIMLYVPKEKWVKRLVSYGALKIHYDAHNGNKEVWEPIHRNT